MREPLSAPESSDSRPHLHNMPDWTGLPVVVTGGTGVLGSAVVDLLLGVGATCHLPFWDRAEVEEFPFRDHPDVHLRSADLTEESSTEAYFSALPPLWASIHCVGGFAMAPLSETTAESYRWLMTLNAKTCFLCCREATKKIRLRSGVPSGGRLVNVAARPAIEPRQGAGMVAYTMSKAAVAALTQSLGEELASEGIWVNAVAPSIIDTPANRLAMPKAAHSTWPSPGAIAETVFFLASPENQTTRGAVVPVYGSC